MSTAPMLLTPLQQQTFRTFADIDDKFIQVANPMVQARFQYKALCKDLSNPGTEVVALTALERFLSENPCSSEEQNQYLYRKVSAHAKHFSPNPLLKESTPLNDEEQKRVTDAVTEFATEYRNFLASSPEQAAVDKEQTTRRKEYKKAAEELIRSVNNQLAPALTIAEPFIRALNVSEATKKYMIYKIGYVYENLVQKDGQNYNPVNNS